MGTELIKAIKITPDGVFLNTKSNNDSIPFHFWKCDSLTAVYQERGQDGLDVEIIRMLSEYATLHGNSENIMRYRYAMDIARDCGFYKSYSERSNQRFQQLPPTDRQSVLTHGMEKPTALAQSYLSVEKAEREKLYAKVAYYCRVYDKIRNRPTERKYPQELLREHPSILATFTEDYDCARASSPRYKRGDQVCLVWCPASNTRGVYAETERGSFPIRAEDFNRVLVYDIMEA